MATASAAQQAERKAERAWSGWLGFASIMVITVGGITALEGLIAVIRDKYFVVTGNQVIVFDMTAWGWIMIVWGCVFVLAGLALASGRSWARWFVIVIASLNVLGQLSFLGSTQYPLWSLVAIGLDTLILYALTVKWGQSS
jgi:hypothetical protein